MIDTSEDTLPTHIMKPLVDNLSRLIHERQLDGRLVEEMRALLDDETIRIRKSGHKCPKLQIVYFESVGWVEIVRADLEHAGIQRLVQNVIRRFGILITVDQLLISIRRAFPSYNGDNAGDEGERVLRVLQQGPGPKFQA